MTDTPSTTPITDAVHTLDHDSTTAALAAATADGPLVEDVECPTCWGLSVIAPGGEPVDVPAYRIPCPDCETGTVRLIVHRADPALAERLRDRADFVAVGTHSTKADLLRAADLIGGPDA